MCNICPRWKLKNEMRKICNPDLQISPTNCHNVCIFILYSLAGITTNKVTMTTVTIRVESMISLSTMMASMTTHSTMINLSTSKHRLPLLQQLQPRHHKYLLHQHKVSHILQSYVPGRNVGKPFMPSVTKM